MLNLLIAIMGGSFEDISDNAAPEILKQKAELLLSIIAEMPDHDKNLDRFPVRVLLVLTILGAMVSATCLGDGMCVCLSIVSAGSTPYPAKEHLVIWTRTLVAL